MAATHPCSGGTNALFVSQLDCVSILIAGGEKHTSHDPGQNSEFGV